MRLLAPRLMDTTTHLARSLAVPVASSDEHSAAAGCTAPLPPVVVPVGDAEVRPNAESCARPWQYEPS